MIALNQFNAGQSEMHKGHLDAVYLTDLSLRPLGDFSIPLNQIPILSTSSSSAKEASKATLDRRMDEFRDTAGAFFDIGVIKPI